MPCELSILLPSIVRPSVSTGCSRCCDGFEAAPGYPPYNIERTGENDYRISRRGRRLRRKRAFARGEGKHADHQGREAGQGDENNGEVLYQGIAARAFERVFQLADYVQVKGAALENGLLHVDLVREIPEAKKPRSIPIGNGKAEAKAQVLEAKAA